MRSLKRSPHLTGHELDTVRRAGVFKEDRRRHEVLGHLAAGCADCRRIIAVGRPAEPDAGRCDPLVLALRDWIRVAGEPALLVAFRPAYRAALTRLADSGRPCDFCRAFLEAGRQLALDCRSEARRITEGVVEDLASIPFPEEVHWPAALQALACAYHGEECLPDQLLAESFLGKARDLLKVDTSEDDEVDGREIRATLYEVQAEVLQAQGDFHPALQMLRAAAGLLRGVETPGRWIENRVREGIALMRTRSSYEAAEVFRDARKELSGDVYPPLRLEVLHRLATLEVQNSCYEDALGCLQESEALYASAVEPIPTQRLWLLGVARLRTGQADAAEAPLRKALAGYTSQALWPEALNALAALGESYLSRDRAGDVVDLMTEYLAIIPEEARVRQNRQLRDLLLFAAANEEQDPQLLVKEWSDMESLKNKLHH